MITWEIVTDERRLEQVLSAYGGTIAVDTETHGTDPTAGRLLGISISPVGDVPGVPQGIYIPVNTYQDGAFTRRASEHLMRHLGALLARKHCVGHNFTYDDRWLSAQGYRVEWIADTRIAWHLASAPSGPRPYDLKSLQVELLGWESRGDVELAEEVAAQGGKLSNGDHYLASLETLAKYACLDTWATAEGWRALKPFFDQHDYHWMLSQMMEYNRLLEANTQQGVAVDVAGLTAAHQRLIRSRDAAKKRLDKQLGPVIEELEHDWFHIRMAKYKRPSARDLYAVQPEKWDRFNWNSDANKRELFYDKLGNEVVYQTESGKPATNQDAVKQMEGDWVASYLKYEKANTLSANFTGPYLNSIRNGRIHPGFNICGTVSYRLSGFKPYLLNAPFDEKAIYKHFTVDEGWVGCHADLSAIEPTITAHYSEDPALLKVFRDGLGDIYLTLALGMFPNDHELRLGYNPNEPITEAVKKRFAKQRKIAKIIHLAVSYTGTKTTVHRNLLKEGIELSIWDADRLVQAYWRTFAKVKTFEKRLRELNRKQGLLRAVDGRIIRVPDPDYKDLFNRFIQAGAHGVLILWVMEIHRLSKEWGIEMRPILLDVHDSTSWAVEEANKDAGMQIFKTALDNVNKALNLSVAIQRDAKFFHSLAGLKSDE
jgi:DNA polymerase I-like protein with 3'-5' exonuclease and polymerase domains